MSRPRLVPDHVPGTTWLHLVSPSAKLLATAVLAVVVVAVRTTGPAGAAALAAGGGVLLLAVAGHTWLGTPPRVVLGLLRRLAVPLAVLAGYQALRNGPLLGLEVLLDLGGLVLLAGLVTVSTPSDRMLDTLAGAARPLSRLPGLRGHLTPDRVALTLALAIRSVDVLWDVAAQARDAARARGCGRDLRALVTPTVVRAVAHARATGDALAARGLVD